MITPPTDDRRLLLQYVLDELPPEQRERMDEALLCDPELFARMQEAQHDLIDAYAAGELAPEVGRQVERALLPGPQGAASKAFAQALHGTVSKRPSAGTLSQTALRGKPAAVRWVWPVGLAAAAVAVLGVALLIPRYRAGGGPPHRGVPQGARVPGEGATARSLPEPSGAEESSRQLAHRPGHSLDSAATTLTLILPPGTARGMAGPTLRLRPETQHVAVQWPVPPDAAVSTFTVELAYGSTIAATVSQAGPTRRVGDLRVAQFVLPAAAFPSGSCLLRLWGAHGPRDLPLAESVLHVQR